MVCSVGDPCCPPALLILGRCAARCRTAQEHRQTGQRIGSGGNTENSFAEHLYAELIYGERDLLPGSSGMGWARASDRCLRIGHWPIWIRVAADLLEGPASGSSSRQLRASGQIIARPAGRDGGGPPCGIASDLSGSWARFSVRCQRARRKSAMKAQREGRRCWRPLPPRSGALGRPCRSDDRTRPPATGRPARCPSASA